jgi:hypothetical protein
VLARRLDWFSGGRAYQLGLDRRALRRCDALEGFHEVVKGHTAAGLISRQEAVSMIPPILLDVQPHHRVRPAMPRPKSQTWPNSKACVRSWTCALLRVPKHRKCWRP